MALLTLGQVYVMKGDYEAAFVQYNKLLSLDGLYWEIREKGELGRKLAMAKIAPVLEAMRQKVAASPDNIESRGELALKLDALTIYDEALREYLILEQKGMKAWMLFYNIGNVYMKQNKFAEAVTYYRKSIASNPQNSDAFNNLGTVLKEQKQYDAALKAFTQALTLNPGFALAKCNIAFTYQDMGKPAEAARVAREITVAFPDVKEKVKVLLEPE
jgi:tetratricopeptide (TPR) repeat protein